MEIPNRSKIQDLEDLTLILDEAAKSVLEKEELKHRLQRTLVSFAVTIAITGAAVIAVCSRPWLVAYLLVFLTMVYWILAYLFARMFWLLASRRLHRALILAIVIPGAIIMAPVFVYGLGSIPCFHAQRMAQDDLSTVIMCVENQRRAIGHPPSSLSQALQLIEPGPFCDKLAYFRGARYYAIKVPLYDNFFWRMTIIYSSKARRWKRVFGHGASLALTPGFPVIRAESWVHEQYWVRND